MAIVNSGNAIYTGEAIEPYVVDGGGGPNTMGVDDGGGGPVVVFCCDALGLGSSPMPASVSAGG